MRKNLVLITLLTATVILFSNMHCKKNDPNPAYVPLDPVFLSYFAFPDGSWWAYKEINSGETDSIYISKFIIENTNDRKSNRYYESLYITFNSKNDSIKAYANPFYLSSAPKDSMKYKFGEIYYGGPNNFNYNAERFFYPAKPGQKLAGSTSNLYIKSYFDTISINGTL